MSRDVSERLEQLGWGIGDSLVRTFHDLPRARALFGEEHEPRHNEEVRLASEKFDMAMYEEGSVFAVLSFLVDLDIDHEAPSYGLLSAGIEESCRNYIDARADLKNGTDYAVDASGEHLVVFAYGAHPVFDMAFVFHKVLSEAVPDVLEAWENAGQMRDAEAVAECAFWDVDRVASDRELIDDIGQELAESGREAGRSDVDRAMREGLESARGLSERPQMDRLQKAQEYER